MEENHPQQPTNLRFDKTACIAPHNEDTTCPKHNDTPSTETQSRSSIVLHRRPRQVGSRALGSDQVRNGQRDRPASGSVRSNKNRARDRAPGHGEEHESEGKSGNPLDMSPANKDVSGWRGPTEGGPAQNADKPAPSGPGQPKKNRRIEVKEDGTHVSRK